MKQPAQPISDAERAAALPVDDRPFDDTPVDTIDLPATPTRTTSIPADAWRQAPEALLDLGIGLDHIDNSPPRARFLRRIGPWLVWRAGPARGAPSRVLAVHSDRLDEWVTLSIDGDGSADGVGPSGQHHRRFRTWKEDLRDHDRVAP